MGPHGGVVVVFRQFDKRGLGIFALPPGIAAALVCLSLALLPVTACQHEKPATPPAVTAVNSPPPVPAFHIEGAPPSHVNEGTDIHFVPVVTGASGKDTLRFSARNLPRWLAFNPKSGGISGRPGKDDLGVYPNIEISVVSNNGLTASLDPFTIKVIGRNTPPVISGVPPAGIDAGSQYEFIPVASDPDVASGDQLRFAVANKPPWAVFDAATGKLSGTPSAENTGSYERIMIAVTDGNSPPATLPPFTIRVNAASAPAQSAAQVAAAENHDTEAWTAMLASPELSDRQKAARALAALGPSARSAAPALAAGLKDSSTAQQIACARALGKIGPDARPAVPELSARTGKSENPELRMAAIEALGAIGDPSALSALDATLLDDDLKVRRSAARALALMGPAARPSVPALISSLKHGNEDAAQALGKIKDPEAVPALTEALGDWRTVYGAAWALKEIGPSGSQAAIALEQLTVSGSTAAIRRMASEALGAVRGSRP